MYNLNNTIIENEHIARDGDEQNENAFLRQLHYAIENNELSVEYQPRYHASSGHIANFEALVRWHRDGETIYPDQFIAEAVKHGLIFNLDTWVFERCCTDLIQLRRDVDSKIKMVINVTPLECESLHYTQKLLSICEANGLLLSDFEFEITEIARTSDIRKIRAFCDTVIERGAAIGLDDFGMCFSPLSNLCELPVNYIKIDKNFTNKMGYGGRSEILIHHLIGLAHEMKIQVVAEGVEHAHQRDRLITMGCDQVQGYFMCKPLPPERITKQLHNMYLLK